MESEGMRLGGIRQGDFSPIVLYIFAHQLNPRFGGGFPFIYEAGVNFPKAIIEWLRGNDGDASLLQSQYWKLFAKNDYLVEIR